jgi:hypothetical protein
MAVTARTFPYKAYFPELGSEELDAAISEVSAQWSGTQEFWADLEATIRQRKRDILLSLLVAWHLADMHPEACKGVVINGGMPLASKESAGVTIKFLPAKYQEALYPLMTNTFGVRAMSMIHSAPERFSLRGQSSLHVPPSSYGTPF